MADAERVICSGGELQDSGAGVRFEVKRGGHTEPAFAIRFRGAVRAYLNRCVHVPRELDWQPQEKFESGMRKTVSWYLDNPQWVEEVVSGGYRNWLDTNYAAR